ncbi:Imm21 family immunity protein [Longispora sp. NPDC051575]|uniref:Imm21 family immunity protein n=1 Tax=Longispora sp. NPDC051575 TaxID=3154943 RepID=UPI00341A8685
MPPTWVTSLFGPLILVPESACADWPGAPDPYPDGTGDHDRAGEVDEYVDVIDFHDAQVLVLGEEQFRTTYLPAHRTLVRLGAADSDVDLPALVGELLPDAVWTSVVGWAITEPVVLFDSAYGGAELAGEEHLRIDLEPGDYVAEGAWVETRGACLILVRLTPRGANP